MLIFFIVYYFSYLTTVQSTITSTCRLRNSIIIVVTETTEHMTKQPFYSQHSFLRWQKFNFFRKDEIEIPRERPFGLGLIYILKWIPIRFIFYQQWYWSLFVIVLIILGLLSSTYLEKRQQATNNIRSKLACLFVLDIYNNLTHQRSTRVTRSCWS